MTDARNVLLIVFGGIIILLSGVVALRPAEVIRSPSDDVTASVPDDATRRAGASPVSEADADAAARIAGARDVDAAPPSPPKRDTWRPGPIAPIPLSIELDPDRIRLGDRLFHDPSLSRDGTVSCASCHDLDEGGVDGRIVSIGSNRAPGAINTPTVLNSIFNFRQSWDGRAADLIEQIEITVHDETAMATDWDTLLGKLRTDPEYAAAFEREYGLLDPFAVSDALATFVRSLITPNARFDRFLRGDDEALTELERTGYDLFSQVGCVTCHQGVNIGGNMFQKFGRLRDYFADKGEITQVDRGRFNITGREQDLHRFKVPSLRNVALTAPYFHDGSSNTLQDSVRVMARYELGVELEDDVVEALSAFLHTLTGESPAN